MSKSIKLAYCLLGNYQPGGVERITASKANYFASLGYEVYLITSSQAGRDFYYEVDSRVKHIDLDIRYDLSENLPRLKAYWPMQKKYRLHHQRLARVLMEIQPDITIASGYHENRFVYKIKDGSIKVIEHHNPKSWNVLMYNSVLRAIPNPSLKTRLSFSLRMLWGRLMTLKYSWYDKHYDVLVLLTEEDQQGFKWHHHTEVIPNPRPLEFDSSATLDNPIVLAVGRLVPQKDMGELISIWSRLAYDYPEWQLHIVGDGYMRDSLESQIDELGLRKQVVLQGNTTNVALYYMRASISVSTSAYEGFPLTMLETITAGLPLVTYACPCGPRDLIQDGSNGFLVEMGDKATFEARLRILMNDIELRKRMGRNARESAELYTHDRVMQKWDVLFKSLLKSKGRIL